MKNLIPRGKKEEENFFHPLASFQKQMNSLFDDFFKGFGEWPLAPFRGVGGKGEFMPRVDVAETDKDIKVTAELPGMTEKDVEVSLDPNNILTLKGEKHEEHEEKEEERHYVERRYGSFYRSIPLSTDVDETKIEASFKHGVLHISLPKKEVKTSQAKKIEIKAS